MNLCITTFVAWYLQRAVLWTLGNFKLKSCWHSLTISMLFVPVAYLGFAKGGGHGERECEPTTARLSRGSPWSGVRGAKPLWSWNTFSFWTFNGSGKFSHFYKIWKRRKPHIFMLSRQKRTSPINTPLELKILYQVGLTCWLINTVADRAMTYFRCTR